MRKFPTKSSRHQPRSIRQPSQSLKFLTLLVQFFGLLIVFFHQTEVKELLAILLKLLRHP